MTFFSEIPDNMSEVIGYWILAIQDAIPDDLRNSPEWKTLLTEAEGTGREHENQCLQIVMDWMWTDVLPILQPQADQQGLGAAWRQMCQEKTTDAATETANAVEVWTWVVEAAREAAFAAARENTVPYAAEQGAQEAVWVACAAVEHAAKAARAVASEADSWEKINPIGLLRTLVDNSTKE